MRTQRTNKKPRIFYKQAEVYYPPQTLAQAVELSSVKKYRDKVFIVTNTEQLYDYVYKL